jgi:hypothetical protein
MKRTKKGKFKFEEVRGPQLKEDFAKRYYARNKKRIDSAIAEYRKSHQTTATNEQIFTGMYKWGRDYGSVKTATKGANRLVQRLRGVDVELLDAKTEGWHRAERGFGDLRKLNKRLNGQFVDYSTKANDDNGSEFEVTGYYSIVGSNVVIAKTIRRDPSPHEQYEYVERTAIGLPNII